MKHASELRTRTLSAVILGAAVIALTLWSFWSFAALCVVGTVILAKEWWGLTKHRSRWWVAVGVVYIGAAVLALIFLRGWHDWFIPILFAIVWSGDISAYLVGKKFGKHKIAPSISPGKSWEGFAASMIASILIACFINYAISSTDTIQYTLSIGLGVTLAIVGLLGDLFESSLKRRAGVKDSGRLIPGHGGLFDRVDALLPSAIAMLLIMMGYTVYALTR